MVPMDRPVFAVRLSPVCDHGLIRGAVVMMRAPNADAAGDYVAQWLRIPNTDVTNVVPVASPVPVMTDDEILTRAADILLARGETCPPGHAENAAAGTCYLAASYIRQERLS
jgi:hypothetical protein